MARPRIIHFYEEVLPAQLPVGQEWLIAYHEHSRLLIGYLRDNGAKRYATDSAIKSLTELRAYLLAEDIAYSPENAESWLQINAPNPKGYQATMNRLSDLYRFGEIQPINSFPMVLPYSKLLEEPWSTLTTEYLDTLTVTSGYLVEKRNCITRFFYKIQTMGVKNPMEITYDLLEEYCKNDAHRSSISTANYTYAISDILLFMADKGLCNHGIGWYPYYRMHGKILRASDLDEEQLREIESYRSESHDFPSEER